MNTTDLIITVALLVGVPLALVFKQEIVPFVAIGLAILFVVFVFCSLPRWTLGLVLVAIYLSVRFTLLEDKVKRLENNHTPKQRFEQDVQRASKEYDKLEAKRERQGYLDVEDEERQNDLRVKYFQV